MNPPHEFETGRLTLRKPLASDTESIFLAYAGDADVTRYITWPPARSIADTQVAVNEMLACWENGSEYSWGIILKQENQLMGMIAVRPFGARVDLGMHYRRERVDFQN